FAGRPTLGLMWINFVNLFMVSLLPFATHWLHAPGLRRLVLYFMRACLYALTLPWNVFEHHVLARADSSQVFAAILPTALAFTVAGSRLRSEFPTSRANNKIVV